MCKVQLCNNAAMKVTHDTPPAPVQNQPKGIKPVKILITEDELIVALDLQVRLKNLGYEIVGIASSGDDALLQVEYKHPDLVLMDIILHGEIDGVETSRQIRDNFDIPIIFLTANADPQTLERAGATHPFSCLLKPFKERELKFSIVMALFHHNTSRQLREANDKLEQRVEERTAELAASYIALQDELLRHKKTLTDLRATQVIADSADRAKNEFLATISHELLTPMNGILGMLDVLLETSPSRQQLEYLRVAQLSGESLLGFINELLDFSGIENGTMEFSPATFSVREQMKCFLAPLALRAKEKGLGFSWSVEDDVPNQVVSDHTRVGQVLLNLVGNSIKFTEHGVVEIKVSQIARENGRANLSFSVRDTGIGVPVEKQKAIFEPFVQADSSFSRRYGGAGLGLSISSRLIMLMGGNIGLESKPGDGSKFHFDLWVDLPES